MKAVKINRKAQPWTTRDEVRQRLGNCRRFLYFAWLALTTDSALFAAVFINSARDEGDGIITSITMHDGRRIDVPTDIPN